MGQSIVHHCSQNSKAETTYSLPIDTFFGKKPDITRFMSAHPAATAVLILFDKYKQLHHGDPSHAPTNLWLSDKGQAELHANTREIICGVTADLTGQWPEKYKTVLQSKLSGPTGGSLAAWSVNRTIDPHAKPKAKRGGRFGVLETTSKSGGIATGTGSVLTVYKLVIRHDDNVPPWKHGPPPLNERCHWNIFQHRNTK